MKTGGIWRSILAGLAACLLLIEGRVPAQPSSPDPLYSTNPLDRAACEIQLNKIFGSIREYRRQHDNLLPAKLSDLTPDYLHDPNLLVCPYVRDRGGLRSWKRTLNELSPDPYTSYSYELSPEPLSYNHWRGIPKKTSRDMKLRLAEILGPVVPIVRCLDHRPFLNLAMSGAIYESATYWEKRFSQDEDLLTAGRLFSAPLPAPPGVADFPARDSRATVRQLDLRGRYNATLTNSWQGFSGNDLAEFPLGLHEFDGVLFDVAGVLQLRGTELPVDFPREVGGIKVGQTCRRLHFLHAVSFEYASGSTNGIYRIFYVDGAVEEFILYYGREIADWWFDPEKPDEPAGARVAWTGGNKAAEAYGMALRLYHAVWENPKPDTEIATVSFDAVMKQYQSGPFVLAITLE